MTNELATMLIAAFALMGSPGPATLSSAAVGAAYGWRRGLRYSSGIMAGTATVLLIIAAGTTGILLTIPALRFAMIAAGSLYILYLAFKIATAKPIAAGNENAPAPGFLPAWMLAVVNPKAYAAIGSVYAGSTLIAGNLLADTIIKIATLCCVIVIVNLSWLVMGSTLSRYFQDPKASRILNISFAVLLVLSVLMTLFI